MNSGMDQYEEQEHEVYGGEIPEEEGEMDAEVDMSGGAEDYEGNNQGVEQDPNSNTRVVPFLLRGVREMQAKVEKGMGSAQDSSSASASQAEKEEVDSCSIYVSNVSAKRTNIPGMKQYRGRPNPYSVHAWSRFLSSIWLREGTEVQADDEIQAILRWITYCQVQSNNFEKIITWKFIMVMLFYNIEGER